MDSWIHFGCLFAASQYPSSRLTVLGAAVAGNELAVARWIVANTVGLDINQQYGGASPYWCEIVMGDTYSRVMHVWPLACMMGSLDIMKWLVEECHVDTAATAFATWHGDAVRMRKR